MVLSNKKEDRKKIRTWISNIWRWSWVVTLPITIILLVWGWKTYERFSDFGIRYNTNFPARLFNIGKMEFEHLIQKTKIELGKKSGNMTSSLRSIDIFLNESDEKNLNKNLPHSGREYVDGRILHPNGKSYGVKIKYRGDTVIHWAYYKKSLRVKTKKKRLFEGLRTFNLISPRQSSQLSNYLSYQLANFWNFITPKAEIVNVRVNGENRGIHLMAEQLDELTLRRSKRMPGDIYSGELIKRDEYRGINNNLFDFPRLWQKIAINNHYPIDSFKPLESLLDHINSPQTEKIQDQFVQMLELNMWGRFLALEILTQSFHFDNQHNWRLYYDPAKCLFEPVIWDPGGLAPGWLPKQGESAQLDIIPSDFHEILLQNYQVLLTRHQALEDFFRSELDKKFFNKMETAINNMGISVESDPNMVKDFGVITPKEAKNAMFELKNSIEFTFNDIRDGYINKEGSVSYSVSKNNNFLQLMIDGRRPVQRLQLNFERPLNAIIPVHIAYWVDGKRKVVDISGATSMAGSSIEIRVPLLARHNVVSKDKEWYRARQIEIKPAYYELIFQGVPEYNQIQSLYADRNGNIAEMAKRVQHLDKLEFQNAFSIVKPQPLAVPEIWTGEINIEGIHKVTGDLIIKPGTTIKMSNEASLIISGRLLAEGTAEKPIRFISALEKQAPWGAVILKGSNANGSRLRYCEFSGGSGLKRDLFEYSAMLSIHDVKGVLVANCHFRENHIVDDMVHAVYADITFSDNLFEGALFDALDLDICTATIERCRFINSGNDAIDLMTTEAIVKDTYLKGNSDKGISVGEDSKLFALNNEIIENEIGVQSKDGSKAVLYNVNFVSNRKAIDAYKKNWRYGNGGTIHLYKSKIVDNDSTFKADKKSNIWVYDSYVKGDVPKSKRIQIDDTVDSLSEQTTNVKKFWRHTDDEAGPELFNSYWSMVNPRIRGTVKIDN